MPQAKIKNRFSLMATLIFATMIIPSAKSSNDGCDEALGGKTISVQTLAARTRQSEIHRLMGLGFIRLGDSAYLKSKEFLIYVEEDGIPQVFKVQESELPPDNDVFALRRVQMDTPSGSRAYLQYAARIFGSNVQFLNIGNAANVSINNYPVSELENFRAASADEILKNAGFSLIDESNHIYSLNSDQDHFLAIAAPGEKPNVLRYAGDRKTVSQSHRYLESNYQLNRISTQIKFGRTEEVLVFSNGINEIIVGQSDVLTRSRVIIDVSDIKNHSSKLMPLVDPLRLGHLMVSHTFVPGIDEASGFTSFGSNTSEILGRIQHLDGETIAAIERAMKVVERPDEPWLTDKQSLVQQIVKANQLVVDQWEIDHQALVAPLKDFAGLVDLNLLNELSSEPAEVVYHGGKYSIEVEAYMSDEPSPLATAKPVYYTVLRVTNLQNGETLRFSLLSVHLIDRIGFYGGEGTSHWVDPSQIRRVFP